MGCGLTSSVCFRNLLVLILGFILNLPTLCFFSPRSHCRGSLRGNGRPVPRRGGFCRLWRSRQRRDRGPGWAHDLWDDPQHAVRVRGQTCRRRSACSQHVRNVQRLWNNEVRGPGWAQVSQSLREYLELFTCFWLDTPLHTHTHTHTHTEEHCRYLVKGPHLELEVKTSNPWIWSLDVGKSGPQ